MPYHPTFAFFPRPTPLAAVLRAFARDLDPTLNAVVEWRGAGGTEERVFESGAQAVAFLDDARPEVTAFWMSHRIHSMEVRLSPAGYLELQFWDFPAEALDEGGDARAEDKQAKLALAAGILRSLVLRGGATLAYISAHDNKYPGPLPHADQAALVDEAVRAGDGDRLVELLEDGANPLVWLLAVHRPALEASPLVQAFRTHAREVESDDALLLLEYEFFRPVFLS
jgi:hypothetical protein